MSYFTWDEDLDVGVEAMNDQHKKLIALMEEVYQKNAAKVGKEGVLQATQTLIDYVIKHFRDEEAYMESINFPGLEAHKQIHRNLLGDLNDLAKKFVASDDSELSEEFMAFLSLWINTHILAIDNKYHDDDEDVA